MRRKTHAGTAIVATIETQMIHKRSAVFLPKHKTQNKKELGCSLTLPNFSKLFFSFFEDNVFT